MNFPVIKTVKTFSDAQTALQNIREYYTGLAKESAGQPAAVQSDAAFPRVKTLASTLVLSAGTAAYPTFTIINLSPAVPASAKRVWGTLVSYTLGRVVYLAPAADGTGYVQAGGGSSTVIAPFNLPLITPQSLWYCVDTSSCYVYVSGYEY